jgi:hypothetical protein
MTVVKFDAALDMSDPQFAKKLAEAIGLEPGETIQISGPQFGRTDRLSVVPPQNSFDKLASLAPETLKAMGLQRWDEADASGNCLWLFPAEWYEHIPRGFMVESIDGANEPFEPGVTDNDRRFGALSYGVRARS